MDDPINAKYCICGRALAFRDIKDINAAWRSVLYLARQHKVGKGEKIQQGKNLYFLERGKVCLAIQNQEGIEKIIWYIHDGSVFGTTTFFDPMPNVGSFICVTNCVIYTFSPQTIDRIGKERPDLLLDLIRSMARKLRIMSYHASSMQLDDNLARICKFLSQRLIPNSNPLTAKIDISRQEMANLLGMHRISLYRVLRQQEKRGMFGQMTDSTITILQANEFYKLVEK